MIESDSHISNKAVIGACPSTGSSLLRRILNRHSQIYCGEETHLFCKKELYRDWANAKSRIYKRSILGLRNEGWHNFTGVILDGDESEWTKTETQDLISKSSSFQEFVDAYYSRMMGERGNTFIDKTPSNVFLFEAFRDSFNGSTIFLSRNPYDTIASLIIRGDGIYQAVSKVLLFNAFGLKSNESENHYALSYEQLILNTEKTVEALLKFLKLEFEPIILNDNSKDKATVSRMKGWNYDEKQSIGNKSINRFDQLEAHLKPQVIYAVKKIKIKSDFILKNNLNVSSIAEIANKLNYKAHSKDLKGELTKLHIEKMKDVLYRSFKSYPYHLLNYPIKID